MVEDGLRDLVIQFGGALYVIGGVVIALALTGWAAWKFKDDSPGLAIFLGCCALGALALVISGLPLAKADCQRAFMSETTSQVVHQSGPYYAHDCQNIMNCHPEFEGNPAGCN